MRTAVFLDRDNTLIANDEDLGDPTLVRLLPGVPEALTILADLGHLLISVSNQGGVARGKYGEDDVRAVNRHLDAVLVEAGAPALEGHYFCPYHPQGTVEKYTREHPLRKPSPGMLEAAAKDHDINLAGSWMIGDHGRDVQAGKAVGCRTILLGEHPETVPEADHRCPDLLAAALLIQGESVANRGAAT